MGEYATRIEDNEHIKVGTCESMYYIRWEDQDKVVLQSGSGFGHFWRLPLPHEDHIKVGNYQPFNGSYILWKFKDPDTIGDPGTVQLTLEKAGLTVNVTCYHGEELPQEQEGFRAFWNGKTTAFYELSWIKKKAHDPLFWPVVSCRFCSKMWRYAWKDVLPFVTDEELKKRLLIYANDASEEELKNG